MKRKVVCVLATGLIVASLAGCGTKTEATDQGAESSNVVEDDGEEETEDISEGAGDTNASVGAEDENIVLYDEKGSQDYIGQKDMAFEEKNVSFVAETDITLYDGDGYVAGYVKTGGNITVTEGSLESTWDRFENPFVEGDYLYILREFVPDENEIRLNAETMKQGIEDFIVRWTPVDVDVTPVFLDEKASDMEVYECRMDSVYDDESEYEYWFLEQFLRKDEFKISDYETFYIECEEDTDGWIICRVYYKDPIDFGY